MKGHFPNASPISYAQGLAQFGFNYHYSVQSKKGEKHTLLIPSCDLGRIQTCNLLSRNQMHYSVMLRGLISANLLHL